MVRAREILGLRGLSMMGGIGIGVGVGMEIWMAIEPGWRRNVVLRYQWALSIVEVASTNRLVDHTAQRECMSVCAIACSMRHSIYTRFSN